MLDEPVFVETGKPYTIRFRTRTGASIERNLVTTWTVAGYISQVTLSESTSDVNEEDLFMFGEYHKESQDLIIISIETNS